MGQPAESPLVKPIIGILGASIAVIDEACADLARRFGEIDLQSDTSAWTASDYYGAEMGPEIWRRYVSLRELAAADALVAWKHETNGLERRWCIEGKRRVNLDPGYVDWNRLVLASTKDAAHRIYLGAGIFAEVTLRFEGGSFRPWSHTYPDYAASEALVFFNRVRARYGAQRRESRRPGPRAD